MNRLENKVAIITGGTSGMGLAAVKLFADEGAKIMAIGMNKTRLQALRDMKNPNIIPVEMDITNPESWDTLVADTLEKFGKIDILINNAGLQYGPFGINETTSEQWDRIMDVNLKAIWLGSKAVIPEMIKNQGGSIINTSSTGGLVSGIADGGSAAYSAAKGGVRSFTKHLASNFGKDNIRVNSVHPGTTMTGGSGGNWDEEAIAAYLKMLADATPLSKKAAEPIDIAYLYLYLASDESTFTTGAEFVVDGGLTCQ